MEISRRDFLRAAAVALAFPADVFADDEKTKRKRKHKYATTNPRNDSPVLILARAIFGETSERRIADLERTAVAYVPINRLNDPRHRWGRTLHDVILAQDQFSCFNPSDDNYKKVLDPESYEPEVFQRCLTIAQEVYAGRRKDPVHANHYHEASLPKPKSWPDTVKPVGRLIVGKTRKGKPIYSAHTFYIG